MKSRKGIGGLAVLVISSLIIFGFIAPILVDTSVSSLNFVKRELVDIQAQRVVNTAMVLESAPEGHIEMELKNYSIRYKPSQNNVTISYLGKTGWAVMEPWMTNYDTIDAPTSKVKIDEAPYKLCLNKTIDSGTSKLTMDPEGC